MPATTSPRLRFLPWAMGLAGLGVLVAWFCLPPAVALQARVPGLDRPAGVAPRASGESVFESRELRVLADLAGPALPGHWPGFRGPARDGVALTTVPLASTWPTDGPPLRWAQTVGEGYAGVAVAHGRVYLLDYDRTAERDLLRCFSLADGHELWQLSYPVKVKRNHGHSRTTPVLSGETVISLGPKGHVLAADALTGEFLWGLDLVASDGTVIPPWYAGQCPLVVDERLILAPAGQHLTLALAPRTGERLWATPNALGWQMTHASLTPVTIAGRAQVVYCGSGGVAGVAVDTGELLWQTDLWKISIATVPSPVALGDGRLFLSGGYDAGAALLQVSLVAGEWQATIAQRWPAKVFGAPQQTPIVWRELVLSIRQDGELAALDPNGGLRWSSGPSRRFALGPMLRVNEQVLALKDDGWLSLLQPGANAVTELARAKVLSGHEAWAPLAFAEGLLLLRDSTTLKCLDLRQSGSGGTP